MEGPSQWSEADTKKARMERVCIISHVNLLFVLRSRGEFCLLINGHFPLAPCPSAEKTKNVVLLSASTLRQDAPEGLGSEELPKNKTKPNYCFLQIIHVSKTSRWRIWGHCVRARTCGEQPCGETTSLDPVCCQPHSPKHSLRFEGSDGGWGFWGCSHCPARSVSKGCSHPRVKQDPLSMHSFPASLLKSTNRISTGNLYTVLCRGKEKKKKERKAQNVFNLSFQNCI